MERPLSGPFIIYKGANMKPNGAVIQQIIRARELGHQEGRQFAYRKYSTVVLLCLADKFDFTPEQLKQASVYINDTIDSVCKGYISLDEIAEILEEENDIKVTFSSEEERQAEVEKDQGFLVVGRGDGKSGRVLEKLREELQKI